MNHRLYFFHLPLFLFALCRGMLYASGYESVVRLVCGFPTSFVEAGALSGWLWARFVVLTDRFGRTTYRLALSVALNCRFKRFLMPENPFRAYIIR